MTEIGFRIDEDELDELLGYASMVAGETRNTESFQNSVLDGELSEIEDVPGDYEVIGFDNFSTLYSMVYESEPRYKLDDIERMVHETEGVNRENGKKAGVNLRRKLKVDKDYSQFFNYLLSHYPTEELSERFNISEETFEGWKTSKNDFVDKKVVEELTDELKSYYDETPGIRPDVINIENFSAEKPDNSTLLENADMGSLDVLVYNRNDHDDNLIIESIRSESDEFDNDVSIDKRMRNIYPLVFREVFDKKQDSGFIKTSNSDHLTPTEAGFGVSLLEDIGLVESWGSDKNGIYSIVSTEKEIFRAWRDVANKRVERFL